MIGSRWYTKLKHSSVQYPSPKPLTCSMIAAGPPSPSLAEISRNTSVISSSSSSSSSSSTSSLVSNSDKTQKFLLPVPARPSRTFAAPSRAFDFAQSQSQAHLLPGYIKRELGISTIVSSAPSSSPLRDPDINGAPTYLPNSGLQKKATGPRLNSPQDFEFGDILGHGSYSTVCPVISCNTASINGIFSFSR